MQVLPEQSAFIFAATANGWISDSTSGSLVVDLLGI